MALKIALTFLLCLLEISTVHSNALLRNAIDLTYDTKDGSTVTHPSLTKYKMTILLRGMYMLQNNNNFRWNSGVKKVLSKGFYVISMCGKWCNKI